MGTNSYHLERLAEEIRQEISSVIAHELRDPEIPTVVTITKVKLSADCRNATVYFSLFDDKKNPEDAIKAINKAAPYIQRLLASRIPVKHFPKLYFKHDNSLIEAERINQLLKEIQDDLA
ncbi:MAG: 30S ribosome-binding factor RbfA [Chitinispirillaceae bacterium]|nr:30S ribosome-binding factor RbfA [Chitinispirillaceae bacterium]